MAFALTEDRHSRVDAPSEKRHSHTGRPEMLWMTAQNDKPILPAGSRAHAVPRDEVQRRVICAPLSGCEAR